jgi:preprotein translocase subunit Sss1
MSRRYDRTEIAKVGVWSALVALAGAVGYIVSVPLQILDVVGPLPRLSRAS